MSKYINADELKKALYHLADWEVTESKYVSLPFIFRAINKEPAADVVEKSKLKELLTDYLGGLYPAEEFMEILEEETE